MPRKSIKPIEKRGINFYSEDITRLQTFFPPRKINHVVRELVHRWLGIIEAKAAAKAGRVSDSDLEILDLETIQREVEAETVELN